MSPRAVPPRSWQVSPAAFSTPLVACLLLLVLLAVAEVAARTPAVRDALYIPSLGSSSRRFEMQIDGLDRYAGAAEVECLVLGNSTALMGVDPQALARGHRERTGRDLRCFNFGVSGMTAAAAEAVAPILVKRHRPALLVYVVTARDVGETVDGPLLANTPWVRYRRGTFSLHGWLADRSAAFRYFLLYRQWLDPRRWPAATSPSGTTAEGFYPIEASLPLSPALWEHTQRAYAEVAGQPLSETELGGFSRLLELSGQGTEIVVVEAPVHPRLQRWARRHSAFYAEALTRLRETARRQHVRFWRVPTWKVVPADGWLDFVHLNRRGAASFSAWLGARIGAAERGGGPAGPRARPDPA